MSRTSPLGGPGGLFRQVVDHPVAMSMLFLAAIVFGAVAYGRLSIELMPDISYPTLTVRTAFDGAAPQEVESQISREIESRMATLDGLVSLESRSRAGQSDVVLGFDWGTDMSQVSQDARESLQRVFLPQGTDRPLLLHYDPSLEPFLRVALSLDPEQTSLGETQGLFMLRQLAEQEIKRELESMKGVAAVQVRGGLEPEIRVEVREDWLAARKLTMEQVRTAMAAENINLAGGSILEGDTEFLVRTLNEFTRLDDVANLKIRRSDGVNVPLSDVAEVFETHRDVQVVSHLNGQPAVELEVFKEADANIVTVAADLKARLLGDPATDELDEATRELLGVQPSLSESLPEGIVLEVLDDQAAFIESAVNNLWNTALLGGLFAVLVLYLFLRDLRATAVIGLAIPVSVVVGFAPLYLGDVSLNLMSLGGLALGVGMLVDNAVVVLESIQRYLDEGHNRRDAAVLGTSDVAAAVIASTLTTVCVFFPIAFVDGVAGELFGDLAIAVVSSLLASLAVALLLVPMAAALEVPGRAMMVAMVSSMVITVPAAAILGGTMIGGGGGVGFALIAGVGLALLTAPSLAGVDVRLPPQGVLGAVAEFQSDRDRDRLKQTLTRQIFQRPMRDMAAWLWYAATPERARELGEQLGAELPPTPDSGPDRAGRTAWGSWALRIGAWCIFPYVMVRFLMQMTMGLYSVLQRTVVGVVARVGSWLGIRLGRGGGYLSDLGARGFQAIYGRVQTTYAASLPAVLRYPGAVIGAVALISVLALGAGSYLGTELIPEVHQGRFTVEAALPVGTPLEVTTRAMATVERVVGEHPDVRSVYTTIGADRRADSASDEGEHTARLRVTLRPSGDMASLEARVMEELRTSLEVIPRATFNLTRPALFSFRTPVEVVVYGHDLGELRQAGDATVRALQAVPGLRDVQTSLVDGNPEVRIEYNRDQLHRYGLDPNAVATRVRDKVQGVAATTMQRGDLNVDVRVQLVQSNRSSVRDLRNLNINPELVPPIPLDAVATITEGEGPSEIRRVDQQRSVVVSANVEGFDLGSAGADIQQAMAAVDLPEGVYYEVAGQSKEMGESLASLQFALALAIFLVYVIMASTFENLIHPFVILVSVPLAVVGVSFTLLLTQTPISVVVFIGAIVLAGVVVNNAIVLVDTINRLRAQGRDRLSAIQEAGSLRLRPILITTMTTVLGLLPLSIGIGDGAEIQQPLAVTVIGGLLSSTLLTLVVIPVVYQLLSGRGGRTVPSSPPAGAEVAS